MPFIENRQEFFKRQDCDHAVASGAIYFENGARISKTGMRYDPPEDPQQLARVKHAFYASRLALRKREWEGLYEAVSTQNEWHGMGVGPTADQRFRGWQGVLDKLHEEISTLEKQVLQLEPELPQEAFQEAYAARRAAERKTAAECEAALNTYAVH